MPKYLYHDAVRVVVCVQVDNGSSAHLRSEDDLIVCGESPMEDTFASLQALLEENATSQDSQAESEQGAREGPHGNPCLPEPSPPDFAMNNDDNEDDGDGDEYHVTSIATKRIRPCPEIPNTTKRRKEKSITICDPLVRDRSIPTHTSRHSIQTNPRTMKPRHRNSIESCELGRKSLSCTNSHVTQNTKTIVGLR